MNEHRNHKKLQISLSTLLILTLIAGLIVALYVTNLRHQAQIDHLNAKIEMLSGQFPEYHVLRKIQEMKYELAVIKNNLGANHPKVQSMNYQIQLFEQFRPKYKENKRAAAADVVYKANSRIADGLQIVRHI